MAEVPTVPAAAALPFLENWAVTILRFADPADHPLPGTVVTQAGQAVPNPLFTQREAVLALAADPRGPETLQARLDKVIDMADATTTVAVMNYQFFTGKLPTEAGLDYLVNSPFNPNDLNDLNDGYYAGMTAENRYINFAVNLGRNGEGRSAFESGYGALSLADATAKAYQEVFGVAPAAGKVAEILNAPVSFAGRTGTRADYLSSLGMDALGAKAAVVGFLLSEAAKTDTGPYSMIAETFLYDVAVGPAAFGADGHLYLAPGPHGVIGIG
jgi:serralysin